MIRRLFPLMLFCLFFFTPNFSFGQLKDTILYSLTKKPKVYLNINTYNSYIGKDFANFSGLRIGLSYNQRVRFGLGFFGLDGGTIIHEITIEDDTAYTTNGDLKFGFVALSAEYIFYNRYPWQFSLMPLQFGFGGARYEYINRPEKQRVSTASELVILYQPDLYGQYSIFRWIGVGSSIGYRAVLYSSKNVKENFNSPTFSLGIKLFIDELYKMAFPHGLCGKKDKQEGEAK